MKIALVTGSPAKYAIAVEHVSHLGVQLEYVGLELVEIQSSSVEAIAENKAAQAFDKLGRACVVEDSAFGIDITDRSECVRDVRDVTSLRDAARLANRAKERLPIRRSWQVRRDLCKIVVLWILPRVGDHRNVLCSGAR